MNKSEKCINYKTSCEKADIDDKIEKIQESDAYI